MQLDVERKEDKVVIKPQYLSLKEEDVLRKRLSMLKDIKDGKEIVQGVTYESKDPKKLDDDIAAIEHELSLRSVRPAVGNERQEVLREIRIVEEDLRKGMPSWEQYANTKRRDGMPYIKIVNWIKKSETDPVRKAKIKRWKFLRRRLDPKDPFIADTMHLFEGTKE
jgi:hypothetical protein